MAALYFDTSALVKRYVSETGTPWITALAESSSAYDIYVVQLAGPEMVAALTRRMHGQDITRHASVSALASFRKDWRTQYQIIAVTSDIVERAMTLAEKHALRGYDAVHLAAALSLQMMRDGFGLSALTFVSADGEQLAAAEAEHLAVENPNTHP